MLGIKTSSHSSFGKKVVGRAVSVASFFRTRPFRGVRSIVFDAWGTRAVDWIAGN